MPSSNCILRLLCLLKYLLKTQLCFERKNLQCQKMFEAFLKTSWKWFQEFFVFSVGKWRGSQKVETLRKKREKLRKKWKVTNSHSPSFPTQPYGVQITYLKKKSERVHIKTFTLIDVTFSQNTTTKIKLSTFSWQNQLIFSFYYFIWKKNLKNVFCSTIFRFDIYSC